jgi:hypothetical protein
LSTTTQGKPNAHENVGDTDVGGIKREKEKKKSQIRKDGWNLNWFTRILGHN